MGDLENAPDLGHSDELRHLFFDSESDKSYDSSCATLDEDNFSLMSDFESDKGEFNDTQPLDSMDIEMASLLADQEVTDLDMLASTQDSTENDPMPSRLAWMMI